ncbi:MAG: glycosyltransferase family 4 protein [Pseudomonadota bacterium]|nr:glycosyltransferase family 4 protein [Pseudomonadota bacterium]
MKYTVELRTVLVLSLIITLILSTWIVSSRYQKLRAYQHTELIIGNGNYNFSGATSITLQLLPYQAKQIPLVVLGHHYIPSSYKTINYLDYLILSHMPHPEGKKRVFYTRRNIEMIQALIAKYIFFSPVKTIFSATSQRPHTFITRWLTHHMDGVVSTSKKAAQYLAYAPDAIIPHGIDGNHFNYRQNKLTAWKELGYPGEIGIGHFSRIRPSKGVDIIVHAAINVLPKFPQATLIIAGETQAKDVAYRQQLIETVKAHHLEKRILFVGLVPYDKLPKHYQGISIVAALSRNEGYGLTPLEGMATGASALVSDTGVWKELVEPYKHGLVVPTNDIKKTEQALYSLLKDIKKTQAMGRHSAVTISNHYTAKIEADRIIAFVKQIQKEKIPRKILAQ